MTVSTTVKLWLFRTFVSYCTCKVYRFHPVMCIISYGYDRQHNNKAEYLRVKTRTDVDMSYLFNT
jgi:hypothetical protein